MATESCLKIAIDIATAFGTIAVAILAIWGERVRSWLSPPKLEIEAHNSFRGDPSPLTTESGQEIGRAMFYHLRVVNKRPWLPIKNCRVLLMGISRRGPDNEFHRSPLSVPRQLVWAPAEFSPVLVTVTKEQIVDFGRVDEGGNGFRPALYSCPNNFAGFVRKDEAVRFELAVEGDNFTSRRYKVFQVAWDGIWEFEPEKMENHLRISEILEP